MSDKLEMIKVSKQQAEVAFKRIKPMIEKYYRDQLHIARNLNYNPKENFGIKELCFSCYTQGLSDGHQLKEKTDER